MTVQQLNVHSFRNIAELKLSLHPSFNIFYGINGSGKTSLLEAFYLLSAGYSFKTRETSPLVRYNDPHLTVFAKLFSGDSISIRKLISGPTQVFLNTKPCKSSSVLARFLPCQVFYQDIFQIIDAGPGVRRSLMDWGVFHVKHDFHDLWRTYRQVLRQRNALLRQKPTRNEIHPWDMKLAALSNELSQLRETYFNEWAAVFQCYLRKLSSIECSIEYFRGWRERGKSLIEILEEQFAADCQRQYTQSGAHQADIRIITPQATAKQGLSRGQQKIILIALKLSQGHLLKKDCLYLFDDIASELDQKHLSQLISCLKEMPGQKIITVLDETKLNPLLDKKDAVYFEMK